MWILITEYSDKKFTIIYKYNLNILEESSTMDEDMGGGEGVASSDDVNDISSAAAEVLSTGIRWGELYYE